MNKPNSELISNNVFTKICQAFKGENIKNIERKYINYLNADISPLEEWNLHDYILKNSSYLHSMSKNNKPDLSKITKVSFEIVYEENKHIRIVNPATEGEGIPANLFCSLIKKIVEVESWYNQTTQK